jgi:hypothetical protein
MGDYCDSLGCSNGDFDADFNCICWPGYHGGEDGACEKIPCLNGCELCTDLGADNWQECFECADGYINISTTTDYVVCALSCPTGYDPDDCTWDDSEGNCIFYYDFNRPDDEFDNLAGNSHAT